MRRAMTPQRHSTKAAQRRHLQPHRPPYNQRWAWKRGEEQFKRDGKKKNTYTHTYKAASTSILPHSHRHTINGPNARGAEQGWRAGPGSRAGKQGAVQWLHSVAALPPLQCQRMVKPGQSSAPSHHHHHHPAAPGGGVSPGWDSISQGHTMCGCSPTVLLEPLPKCRMRRAADGVCAHFGAGWG